MSQFIETATSRVAQISQTNKRRRDAEAVAMFRHREAEIKNAVERYMTEMAPYETGEKGEQLEELNFSVNLRDKRFKPVNMSQIHDNMRTYDNNEFVSIVTQMINNASLGGKVIVKIPGVFLSEDEKEWWSKTLVRVGRQGLRVRDCAGFVSWGWIPRPGAIKGEPFVANFDHLLVNHNRGLLNLDDYVYVEKPQPHQLDKMLGDITLQCRVLKNIYTTTEQGPNQQGGIVSRVSRLKSRLIGLRVTDLCSMRANIRRSMPDILVGSEVEAPDLERAQPGRVRLYRQLIAAHDEGLLQPGELAAVGHASRGSSFKDQWMNSFANYYGERTFHTARTHPDLEPTAHAASVQQEAELMFDLQRGPVHGYKIELPPGHHVERTQLPEAPKDQKEMDLLVQQAVFMQWVVPPSMMQAESSQGRVTAVDHNMLTTWFATVRATKQFLIDMFRDMLNVIYRPEIIAHIMKTTPLTEKLTPEKLKRGLPIEIELPGSPPVEEIHNLYQLGVLKYEAYKEFLSSIYTMPESSFEATAKIKVEDLLTQGKANLIPAPVSATTKGKAGAKKPSSSSKPKGKSS